MVDIIVGYYELRAEMMVLTEEWGNHQDHHHHHRPHHDYHHHRHPHHNRLYCSFTCLEDALPREGS